MSWSDRLGAAKRIGEDVEDLVTESVDGTNAAADRDESGGVSDGE
jgi:hypothetical protein